MATLRALAVFGLVIHSMTHAIAQEERVESFVSAPPAKVPATSGGASEPSIPKPDFSLIVRIDNSALDPLRAKDIQHQGTVSLLPSATQTQVLQMLFGTTQTVEKQMDVGFQQGWVVLGLQNDTPTPAVAVLSKP